LQEEDNLSQFAITCLTIFVHLFRASERSCTQVIALLAISADEWQI